MDKNSRIYVAGHRGLVGSAIHRQLKTLGYRHLITRSHAELDLCNQTQVEDFFVREKPEYVILAAAKVGGIGRNDKFRADMILDNLEIQTQVIHASLKHAVKKLCFLGSSCIYPKMAPQPMTESALLSGPLEPTNEAYAVAKIAGLMLCKSIALQHKRNFISVMPTNVYGPGDNYDLENSHVLPALIAKVHHAKIANAPTIEAWGSGSPLREFIFSEDLADAILLCMEKYNEIEHINIGSGQEITIKELLHLVMEVVGFQGKIEWRSDRPDGTPRKLLDCRKLFALGWKPKTPLKEGIRVAYQEFLSREK